MPLFGPRERKDKRKATEEPSDGRGNSGKITGSKQRFYSDRFQKKKYFLGWGSNPQKYYFGGG